MTYQGLEPEADWGDVALYDVSHQMPRRASKRQYRDPTLIQYLFVHHSGSLGRSGLPGALASASYMVGKRKFPGPGYTFWVPSATERDDQGRTVVFRLNQDTERSWHTGGRLNEVGVAICLQGNTTTKPLTDSHLKGLECLIPYCYQRYDIPPENLGWHSIATKFGGKKDKKACPGKHAEEYLRLMWSVE